MVLYDYLVNPRLLQHVRPGTECLCMGRHGMGKIWKQNEINSECIRLAQQGQQVVRLKSGDPAILLEQRKRRQLLNPLGSDMKSYRITAALASGTCGDPFNAP